MRFAAEAFHKRGGEARFADPCLTGDQDHLPFACFCPGPAPQQQFKFFLPAHKGGQAGRVPRLEAALDRPCSQYRPGPRWPGDALEVLGPKVPKLKKIAEKPSRAFADDNCVRRGDALQARISPTPPRSWASPEPTRSPTTTSEAT